MKTAVAILNWNGFNLLNKFLPSVIKNTPAKVDIYIIDNGSTDKSIDFISTYFPSVKIMNLDNNYGYAKGYNLGIKKIDADIICLLNNDVEVTANWTDPIIELFKSEKDTAIIQPKLLDYNNRKMFDYAGAAGGFLDKFGYPYCRGRIYNNIEVDDGQYDDISKIFWACGACFFIRKDILTGTPAPNRLEDINTQYQILYPGPEYTGDRFCVRTTKNELKLPEPKIKLVNVKIKI